MPTPAMIWFNITPTPQCQKTNRGRQRDILIALSTAETKWSIRNEFATYFGRLFFLARFPRIFALRFCESWTAWCGGAFIFSFLRGARWQRNRHHNRFLIFFWPAERRAPLAEAFSGSEILNLRPGNKKFPKIFVPHFLINMNYSGLPQGEL